MTATFEFMALFEAQNYLGMFNDFLTANPSSRNAIDRYVKWAKTTLKKNDRITWFLRFVRVELAGSLRHADSDAELAKLNKRLGVNYSRQDLIPLNNLMTTLAHYLAMPIAEIQNAVWLRQSPTDLTNEFHDFEHAANKSADDDAGAQSMYQAGRLIARDSGDDIVLRCPDGLCWVDLNRYSCSAEGKAMGHCGNTAAGRSGETVLSLRRPISFQGKAFWYPVATFILDSDHLLGEMKGRGNDKPADRYHEDIILLLRSDLVAGIKGGGYLSQNNFSMDDLDPATAKALIEEKPLLGGLELLYRLEGMSDRVQRLMNERLRNADISAPEEYRPDQNVFVLDSWRDFDGFLRDLDQKNLTALYDIATGEDSVVRLDPQEAFAAMVHDLPASWQEALLQRASMPGERDARRLETAARALIQRHDAWYDVFQDLMQDHDVRLQMAWDRLDQYFAEGLYFSSSSVYTNLPHDLRSFLSAKPRIELLIGARELMGIATGDDDDDEYGHERYAIARNGWASLDENDDYERWHEAGLVDRNGQDKWLQSDAATLQPEDSAATFIDAVKGVKRSSAIDDPRQSSLPFESVSRLRQLAGLARV